MTAAGFSPAYTLFLILLMHVLLPAALSLGTSELLRKTGWSASRPEIGTLRELPARVIHLLEPRVQQNPRAPSSHT